MYKKDFQEYIKILLRTKSSYRILLRELENIHHLEDMTMKQRQKLRALLFECDKDIDKLINELKERGELIF
jgi:hypothetical protein